MNHRMNINEFHQNTQQDENKSHSTGFTSELLAVYSFNAFTNPKASRGKLKKSEANDSTPILSRVFFVRRTRTPKENAQGVIFSMVGRKEQRLTVGCFSFDGSFPPLYALPPAVESLAVSLYNQLKDTAKMIYKFLCLDRTQSTYNEQALYIEADSEENARFQLTADYQLLIDCAIARFKSKPTACNHSTNSTHPTTAQGGVYA